MKKIFILFLACISLALTFKLGDGVIQDETGLFQSWFTSQYAVLTLDTYGSDNGGNNQSGSFSYTIGSGSNRILILGLTSEDSNDHYQTMNYVRYNSTNLTYLCTYYCDNGSETGWQVTHIYYMLEADLPTTGAYTLEYQYDITVNGHIEMAISFENAEQEAPTYEGIAQTTGYNIISDSITTTVDNSYIIDWGNHASNDGDYTQNSGQSELVDTDGNTTSGCMSYELKTSAGEETHQVTYSGTDNRHVLTLVGVKPKAL